MSRKHNYIKRENTCFVTVAITAICFDVRFINFNLNISISWSRSLYKFSNDTKATKLVNKMFSKMFLVHARLALTQMFNLK